jgi:hypothetical protein
MKDEEKRLINIIGVTLISLVSWVITIGVFIVVSAVFSTAMALLLFVGYTLLSSATTGVMKVSEGGTVMDGVILCVWGIVSTAVFFVCILSNPICILIPPSLTFFTLLVLTVNNKNIG